MKKLHCIIATGFAESTAPPSALSAKKAADIKVVDIGGAQAIGVAGEPGQKKAQA